MKIRITLKTKQILDSLGNATRVKNGYKIYAALYGRSWRKNTQGYFDVPSTFLKAINSRYEKIIKRLLQERIIEFKSTNKIDPNDIFQTKLSKTYSSHMGYCMKYRFVVDVSSGIEMEVDMTTGRKERWYEITANSLIELGYEAKIIRDSFGRRVYYPLIQVYKKELENKGLCIIDAKTSHPRLLWVLMNRKGIIDPNYNHIFNEDLDLYDYLASTFSLGDRKAGRDLFSHWINGDKFLPDFRIMKLFPIATSFIKGMKRMYYKDSASFLQREEAKIWIDDLLENIPADFGLPVHDSLIVKNADLVKVLGFCKAKYPDLRFATKTL